MNRSQQYQLLRDFRLLYRANRSSRIQWNSTASILEFSNANDNIKGDRRALRVALQSRLQLLWILYSRTMRAVGLERSIDRVESMYIEEVSFKIKDAFPLVAAPVANREPLGACCCIYINDNRIFYRIVLSIDSNFFYRMLNVGEI